MEKTATVRPLTDEEMFRVTGGTGGGGENPVDLSGEPFQPIGYDGKQQEIFGDPPVLYITPDPEQPGHGN